MWLPEGNLAALDAQEAGLDTSLSQVVVNHLEVSVECREQLVCVREVSNTHHLTN